MKNLFLFNFKNNVDEFDIKLTKLKSLGFNVISGPSEDDHAFLIEQYDYYRTAINESNFVLASEIWGAYKLSREAGVFVNNNYEIDDDFIGMLNDISKYQFWAAKISDLKLSSEIILSSKSDLFEEILGKYMEYDGKSEISTFPNLSQIISEHFIKIGMLEKHIWENKSYNSGLTFGSILDFSSSWKNKNMRLVKNYLSKYCSDSDVVLKYMQKNDIKISFIAPAFKVDNYLSDFFESFNKLTIDYEIILVNDDPNVSLNKWASDRVKVVNNNVNVGQGESRNIGLKYISSDSTHFSFIDPDDRIGSTEFEDNISKNIIVDYTHNVWYMNKLVGPKTNGKKGPQGVAKTIWGVIFPILLKDDKDILCREGEINDYPIKMRLSKRYYIHKSSALMIDYRMRKSSTTRTTFSRKRALQQVYSYFSLEKDGFLTSEQAKNKAYEELLIRKKSFTNEEFNKLKKELKPGTSKWFGFTGTMSRVTHTIQIIKFFIDLFSFGKPFD